MKESVGREERGGKGRRGCELELLRPSRQEGLLHSFAPSISQQPKRNPKLTKANKSIRPLSPIDLVPVDPRELQREIVEVREGLFPRVGFVGDDEVDDGGGDEVAAGIRNENEDERTKKGRWRERGGEGR